MKKVVLIGVIILVLLCVILAFIGNYFYNLALNPNTSKDEVFSNSKKKSENKDKKELIENNNNKRKDGKANAINANSGE